MSGGVDSSVVAYILKEKGYDIFGLTMKHLDYGGDVKSNKPCCSLEDIYDAKKICKDLDIPHYTINLKNIFKKEVIDTFVDDYSKGKTPNPCVKCNREVKLKAILEYVEKLGGQFLATGHYAILKDNKIYSGVDDHKDQSYFLSQVRKEDISKMLFPLGELTKEEVRVYAQKLNLKPKQESQGVCFINSDYKAFLNKKLSNSTKGNIVDTNGNILGEHDGLFNFTIGQRKGIGISSSFPYYVVKIKSNTNEIVVGEEKDLFSNELICSFLNLFVDEPNDLNNKNILIKTRARDIKSKAIIKNIDKEKMTIIFNEKIRAITSGQIVAFYDLDNSLLGSGVIE